MPLDLIVDNDVLIKASCFSVLQALVDAVSEGAVGVLGTARFVVADRLERDDRISDRNAAKERWASFLADAEVIEPDEDVRRLATDLEEAALEVGLPLDGGESLLCAEAILRRSSYVLTGDKRAISALEQLIVLVDNLQQLAGRMLSMEQFIYAYVQRFGSAEIRNAICAEAAMDRVLSICFQCGRGDDGSLDADCLPSYIRDLLREAPTLSVKDFALGVP